MPIQMLVWGGDFLICNCNASELGKGNRSRSSLNFFGLVGEKCFMGGGGGSRTV